MHLVHQGDEQSVGCGPLPGRRIRRILASHDLGITSRIRAKVPVHVVVVPGVVLVKRRRVVHRVEVEGGHSEILEVVELVDDTLEVTAVPPQLRREIEIASRGLGPWFLSVPVVRPRCGLPATRLHVWPGALHVGECRIVRRIAIAESLHEDLIPDHVLGPGRNGEVGLSVWGTTRERE